MISTRFCPVCGAANELARTSCFACGGAFLATVDEQVESLDTALLHERYQPGMLLGEGGFSTVYRARDVQAGGRTVAIKQINLQGLSAEETIDATNTFNREVNLLSILHHPQIPQLYDHFNDRDHWYLILEYLAGMTLEVYLEKRAAQGKPIQIDEALAMALQLCTVLEYLHTRQPPVIFRDLKPGNIIRTPGGKLCLIDFGIARTYRPGQSRDTQRLGSPGYAAPEQYGSTQTTPQADIYSLGALLHALLSGQDPALQERGLAPLHLAGYAGEAELAALVQCMLAPVPADRPAQVSEVADMLRYVQEKQRASHEIGRIWVPPLPQTQPVTSGSQQHIQIVQPTQPAQVALQAKGRRSSRRALLIGFGALAATLAGGDALWQMLKPRYYPMPPFSSWKPAPDGTLFTYKGHSDAVWSANWSPDAQRVASASYDHTVQVWDSLGDGNPFTYQGHNGAVINANWSPDGTRIASASDDLTVQVWDASDGRNVLIYRGHDDYIQEANWSPDGQRIASASIDKTVQIWDSHNGNQINTYREHTQEVLAAKWSPDGKHIASSSGDTTVRVWDAATMHTLFVYQLHAAAVNEVAWSPDGTRIASASDDGTVQVWDAFDGNNVRPYTRHTQAVNSVAWSGDGTLIASASSDKTAQVWDALYGALIFTYTGHTQPVQSVAWSPKGTWLASASEDSTVQIWQAP